MKNEEEDGLSKERRFTHQGVCIIKNNFETRIIYLLGNLVQHLSSLGLIESLESYYSLIKGMTFIS